MPDASHTRPCLMNQCSQQHSQEVSTISSYKEGSSEKGRDLLKVTEIGVKAHSKLHVLSPCSPLSATASNGPPRPDCASSPSSPKATLYPPPRTSLQTLSALGRDGHGVSAPQLPSPPPLALPGLRDPACPPAMPDGSIVATGLRVQVLKQPFQSLTIC